MSVLLSIVASFSQSGHTHSPDIVLIVVTWGLCVRLDIAWIIAKDTAAGCVAATGRQCTKRLPTLEDFFSVDDVNTIYLEQWTNLLSMRGTKQADMDLPADV